MLGQKEEGGLPALYFFLSEEGGEGGYISIWSIGTDTPHLTLGGGGIPRCMFLTGEISCFVLYIISVIC